MFRIIYKNGTSKELETPQNTCITKIKSDELDSVQITIPHVEELNLHLKDKIILENEYFLCGTFKKDKATPNGLFNYTISLISPTILLEDYILPNRTITSLIDETRHLDYYFDRYLEEYAPNIVLTDNFRAKLETLEAYEEQFPCLNLKEVFNKMLEPYGLVCKMINYTTLDYLDLNARETELDINNFTFISEENKFDEYASCLQMNIENAVSKNFNITEKGVTLKSSEIVVNDSNILIPTKHPIYEIDKVICYCQIATDKNEETETEVYALDITDYIVEKSIYDTKKVTNVVNETSTDYKRNNLYFNFEGQNIEGLTFQESTWFLGTQTQPAIFNILEIVFKKTITINFVQIKTNIRDLIFDITYKATQSINVKFFKDKYTNERTLIDSQSASYVDVDKLSKSEKEKVNRCGNKCIHIGGRFEQIPSINSRIENFYTTQINAVYKKGYYTIDMYLYEDFTRNNISQALNQKIRYTQIDTSKNAVTRIENTIVNAVITQDEESAVLTSNLGSALLLKEPLFIYKTFSNDVLLSTSVIYPSIQKMDYSLIISFKMDDNFTSGLKIGNVRETGGYGLEKYSYTNENGEVDDVTFAIYDHFPSLNSLDYNSYLLKTREFPEYTITGEVLKYALEHQARYKDNKEILGETIQIGIKAESENIKIYDEFFNILLKNNYLTSNAGNVTIENNSIVVENVVNNLIIYNYGIKAIEVLNNTKNKIFIKEVK